MPGLKSGARSGASEPTASERPQESAPPRDTAMRARLAAAQERDERADDRDVAANVRDRAAEVRDQVIARPSVMAQHRVLSARDRRAAGRDRAAAVRDRIHALVDRTALALALETTQQRLDEALRHQRRAEILAHTLQRSLSPPSLPPIAGLDVAVHYEPSAPEEVGSDFYDVFPLSPGRSGFLLGDVGGGGAEAATVTSLARYTMRTAAILRQEPVAVLLELNSALLTTSRDPQPTCTAVCGEIDLSTGPAAVALAVAGRTQALIVRARGDVEPAPARGTVLGAVSDPTFRPCDLRLRPGDTVVLHTDGILDAALDGVVVDEERVADLLRGPPRASAQAIVDRLVRALRGADRPPRDDVAIMALRRSPA